MRGRCEQCASGHGGRTRGGGADLEHGRALEHDEHEQREERVVPVRIDQISTARETKEGRVKNAPVLVHAPQASTEDLENEERRNGVFGEQLSERRHGDVKVVLAVVGPRRLDLLGGREARGRLEGRQRRRRVARVGDAAEAGGRGVELVLVALVREEDEVVLALAL